MDKMEASPGEWRFNGKVSRTSYYTAVHYCNNLKRFKQHCEDTSKVISDPHLLSYVIPSIIPDAPKACIA
jgi:hypothetical protein